MYTWILGEEPRKTEKEREVMSLDRGNKTVIIKEHMIIYMGNTKECNNLPNFMSILRSCCIKFM